MRDEGSQADVHWRALHRGPDPSAEISAYPQLAPWLFRCLRLDHLHPRPRNCSLQPRKVIGPRGEGSKKIVPPSKEDMRALIDAAGEELRLILLFGASTGARAGEQWAARWRDVNLDKGELHISRRVDVYGDEGAPKSTAG